MIRLLDHGVAVATGAAAVETAARHLRAGTIVVIPTDTVYGIAAALDDPAALADVFRVKGRPDSRSLPILVEGPEAVTPLLQSGAEAAAVTRRFLNLAATFWPGGLTIALPARNDLSPAVLASDGSAGFRVPNDPVARELLRAVGGALAVTSANRSGDPTPADPDAIAIALGAGSHPLRWVLADGPRSGNTPSTVIGASADGSGIVVHRDGAIAVDAILAAWHHDEPSLEGHD